MLWWTLRLLKSKDSDKRECAIKKLGNLGKLRGWSYRDRFVEALKDKDRNVQKAAAEALDSIGWHPANDTQRAWYSIALQDFEMAKNAVPQFIAELKDNSDDVRESAAYALESIGREAVEPLIASVRDNFNNLRVADVAKDVYREQASDKIEMASLSGDQGQLAKAKVTGAWDIFSTAFTCVAIHKEMAMQIEILGRIRDSRAVEPLIRIIETALKDRGYYVLKVAVGAIKVLGIIGNPNAFDLLTIALKDMDSNVQNSAKEALTKVASK